MVSRVSNALARSVSKTFFGIGSFDSRPIFHIPIVDSFHDLSKMKNIYNYCRSKRTLLLSCSNVSLLLFVKDVMTVSSSISN
jgi:hypothetical protein